MEIQCLFYALSYEDGFVTDIAELCQLQSLRAIVLFYYTQGPFRFHDPIFIRRSRLNSDILYDCSVLEQMV